MLFGDKMILDGWVHQKDTKINGQEVEIANFDIYRDLGPNGR